MKARIIFSLAMVFVLVGCAVKPYTPPRATPSYAQPIPGVIIEQGIIEDAQRKAETVAAPTTPAQVSWRAPRKTRILSVGVGDFKDTAISKIDYAESDARGFASLTKSSGIPEENVSHLTNKDAG
ncbi:MAG: hypothetical protein JRE64_00675 [Deltaproteobacteria bacterium]|nr:hypothetical protein [Deltaproteobacteria bacterium]